MALVVFIGIVIWAWSSRRKKDFTDAANLIFDEKDESDRAETGHESGEQKHV